MDLIAWFTALSPTCLYIAFFLVFTIEGTGVPAVPFEPLFLAAGYLIDLGEVNFWLVVLSGGTGNLAGNLLGYWIGASPGHKFLQRFLRFRDNVAHTEKWHYWFKRYGPGLVVFARWFGPIRTVTIIGAGAMGMKFWSFLVFSAIGAYTWTAAWQWIFWKFAGLTLTWWERYRENSLFITALGITALLVVAGLLLWWRKR